VHDRSCGPRGPDAVAQARGEGVSPSTRKNKGRMPSPRDPATTVRHPSVRRRLTYAAGIRMMMVMVRPEHNDEDSPRGPMARRQVIEILQAHQEELRGFGVKKIRLFGSVARESAGSQSDVDMVVEFSEITYRRFVALKAYLESILGREVDRLTPAAVQGRLKDEIEKDLVDVPT
jgi:predicted nucleotidyltransferase